MTKKSAYIDFIVSFLQSGIVEKPIVYAKFGEKWRKGSRTFDRYWVEANHVFSEKQQEINKKKDEEIAKSQIETAKATGITRETYLTMVSNAFKIAYKDVLENAESDKVSSKLGAFISVADRLSKLEGYDKPTKVSQTDNEGKNVPIINIQPVRVVDAVTTDDEPNLFADE